MFPSIKGPPRMEEASSTDPGTSTRTWRPDASHQRCPGMPRKLAPCHEWVKRIWGKPEKYSTNVYTGRTLWWVAQERVAPQEIDPTTLMADTYWRRRTGTWHRPAIRHLPGIGGRAMTSPQLPHKQGRPSLRRRPTEHGRNSLVTKCWNNTVN